MNTKIYKNNYRVNISAIAKSAVLIVLIIVSGCATTSPHENFKDHIHGEIGKSIDNAPAYSWRYGGKDLTNARLLPNGNVEKEYKYIRSCRYFFEIDPKTRIIVGARFEGNESDCVVAP